MPATWYWRCKLGTATFEVTDLVNQHTDLLTGKTVYETRKRKCHCNLYTGGNCLAVMLWEYKGPSDDPNNIDPKTNKIKIVDRYRFDGFWSDIKHLKNILGLNPKEGHTTNVYNEDPVSKLVAVKLNIAYHNKAEIIKAAELFASVGIKATLYYKKPKPTKPIKIKSVKIKNNNQNN